MEVSETTDGCSQWEREGGKKNCVDRIYSGERETLDRSKQTGNSVEGEPVGLVLRLLPSLYGHANLPRSYEKRYFGGETGITGI